MRLLGYLLFALALVSTVLALTHVQGYEPDRGNAWNLANAYLFPRYETSIVTRTCPGPVENAPILFAREPRMPDDLPEGCPSTVEAWTAAANPTYEQTTRLMTFSLRFGDALAMLVAVAAFGLGMTVFGRR